MSEQTTKDAQKPESVSERNSRIRYGWVIEKAKQKLPDETNRPVESPLKQFIRRQNENKKIN